MALRQAASLRSARSGKSYSELSITKAEELLFVIGLAAVVVAAGYNAGSITGFAAGDGTLSVLNENGANIQGLLEFYDTNGNLVSTSNVPTVPKAIMLGPKLYRTHILPASHHVTQVRLNDVDYPNNYADTFAIRDAAGGVFYFVNISSAGYAGGTFEMQARGRDLYGCALWDSLNSACTSGWVKVRDLVLGRRYNFTLWGYQAYKENTNFINVLGTANNLIATTETLLSNASGSLGLKVSIDSVVKLKSLFVIGYVDGSNNDVVVANSVPSMTNYTSPYSVDTSLLSSGGVNVSAGAQLNSVQTCYEWSGSACSGGWYTLASVTPGADYNLQMPGTAAVFGELNLSAPVPPPPPADTAVPAVAFVSPTPSDGTSTSNTTHTFNATIIDSASKIDICLLEWRDGSAGVNESGFAYNASGLSRYCHNAKSGLAVGVYQYKIWANDSAGNAGASALRTVIIAALPAPAPAANVSVNASVNVTVQASANVSVNISAKVNITAVVLDTLRTSAEFALSIYKEGALYNASNLDVGTYDIDIVPALAAQLGTIKISGASITEGTRDIVRVDDVPKNITVPFSWSAAKAFAIDPKVNFTNMSFSSIANGTQLWKCKAWDFETRNCTDGNWTLLMSVLPGTSYTLNLSAGDPGFVESNSYCGDSVCQTATETCTSCSADCGVCAQPSTSSSTSSTTSSSSSSSSSSGGGLPVPGCNSEWECAPWGACTGGKQTRTCMDKKGCNGEGPPLQRTCIVTAGGEVVAVPAAETSAPACAENWFCGEWGPCENGEEKRTCNDANSCGTFSQLQEAVRACTSLAAATTEGAGASGAVQPLATGGTPGLTTEMLVGIIIAAAAAVIYFAHSRAGRKKGQSYSVKGAKKRPR